MGHTLAQILSLFLLSIAVSLFVRSLSVSLSLSHIVPFSLFERLPHVKNEELLQLNETNSGYP